LKAPNLSLSKKTSMGIDQTSGYLITDGFLARISGPSSMSRPRCEPVGSQCDNLRVMPSKKKSRTGKSGTGRIIKRAVAGSLLPPLAGERTGSNGTQYECQRIRNPHVPGEREKMLEKREALTLKAFQIAFENHHPHKGS
jgi:hypothetical protein